MYAGWCWALGDCVVGAKTTPRSGIPKASQPLYHLLLSDLFVLPNMVAGNGLTVVVFIYISLVYNESENLFLGLLAICINFSVKCLYVSSHFLNQFVDVLYIFWILIHCADIISQFWLTFSLFFNRAGTMLKGMTRLISRVHKVSPH